MADDGAGERPASPNASASAAAPAGLIYVFGFIGALVYYVQTSGSFGAGVFGVLKSFVWPAFLVYELLHLVNA